MVVARVIRQHENFLKPYCCTYCCLTYMKISVCGKAMVAFAELRFCSFKVHTETILATVEN